MGTVSTDQKPRNNRLGPEWMEMQPFKGALDEAKAKDWAVVDMKNDWNIIFPFETERDQRFA